MTKSRYAEPALQHLSFGWRHAHQVLADFTKLRLLGLTVSQLDRRLCVEALKQVLFNVNQQQGASESIRDEGGLTAHGLDTQMSSANHS
jgi:hypothetical protein